MEEQIKTIPEEAKTVEVVDVQFRPGQKVYYFDPAGITCKTGDHIIIETARGPEFGICAGGNHRISTREVVSPLRSVLRLANAQDEKVVAENRAKEKKAFDVCLKKIAEQGLDMQLVSAEVAFDGSKILFFFTADERVDFRELVKNLASVFHTRIELRQIGVRDKAKMVGGLGICGRPFCCASFLDDFQPVSIKMAKTQNLSLNPTKISGTCGRLMCCLKYEQEAYEDLIRNSPKLESFVDTPEGRGTVVELDLLRSRVKVRMEENPETVSAFPNAEIYVLRSGKAKKNDPPIPADLAPISGSGKRTHREEKEEKEVFLDPIRFRYRSDAIVEEQPEVPAEPAAESAPAEGRSNRNRRRKKNKPQTEVPAKAEPKAQEQKKQPEGKKKPENKPKQEQKPKGEPKNKENKPAQGENQSEGGADAAKKPHRRYNHHRRKPKQNPEGGN